jgi:hypothetical protein
MNSTSISSTGPTTCSPPKEPETISLPTQEKNLISNSSLESWEFTLNCSLISPNGTVISAVESMALSEDQVTMLMALQIRGVLASALLATLSVMSTISTTSSTGNEPK